MFDPQTKQAISERLGSAESQVSPSSERTKSPEQSLETLWEAWGMFTHELLEQGISQSSLCSATGQVAAVRAERESAQREAVGTGEDRPVG